MAANGNMKEVKRLYEADTSRIFLKDTKGQTPLHHAASRGSIDVIEFLIEKGAGLYIIINLIKIKTN